MNTVKHLLIIILSLVHLSAFAISRKDVLECGLPNGDKFILEAKYDWNPIAKLIPADVAERLNQEGFKKVFFQKKDDKKILLDNDSRPFVSLESQEGANDLCAGFGLKNQIIYSSAFGYLLPKKKILQEIEFNKNLHLSNVCKENIEKICTELNRLNVSPSRGAVTLVGGRMVIEFSLAERKNGMIIAVFKNQSLDMGKTWGDPIITTIDAEIFELGKTIQEQSFIARPIKINGKRIDVKFPPAPDVK